MENESQKSLHLLSADPGAQVFVSDQAFITAIGTSAAEVEGFCALADSSSGDGLTSSSLKAMGKAMNLEFDQDKMTVSLSVVVSFGTALPEFTEKLRKKIICTVANMIGYTVERVNIHIADIML